MRVLMLDNEFPPLGGGMGVVNQTVLHELAARSDVEIDLLTSALGANPETEQFSDRIRIFKVPVRNKNIHHSSNRELILYALQAFWLAEKLHRQRAYDLCFAWSAVPAGAIAWLLKKLNRLPYLVVVSGPDIPGFERRYKNVYKVITPLIRAIWRQASPLIVQSKAEADLVHTVVKEQPVEIVPNGVDLSKFSPGLPIPEDGALQILCVARLIERKGQHYLIHAVKRLTDEGMDVIATLVGTGDAFEENRSLAKNLNVADRVRFLGVVPRDAMPDVYAAAHVFALPSFNEGMSMAALEAMGAGLPLLLTPTGGTWELVEEGVNGFVHRWGDVDGLVGQLRRLAQDRRLARQMGECSHQRAGQFSWGCIADRYYGYFEKISRLGMQ